MPCSLFNPAGCVGLVPDPVGSVASGLVDGVLSVLAAAIAAAIKAIVLLLASWIFVPSTPVCPSAAAPSAGSAGMAQWVAQCQQGQSPSAVLRGYVLPLTIIIAVIGLLWQAIVMTVTRKGEPLIQVVRGLWNSALWGAVGIAGTQLALTAGDSFADWVLIMALHNSNPGPPNEAFTGAIGGMLTAQLVNIPVVGIFVGIALIFVLIIQIVLLLFRAASVAILAGLLQLAASGSFTRATSPWLPKIVGWIAALIVYKPAAALVYATGLAFMSDKNHPANFVIGAAVVVLSVIALPALMKFFNWTVGAATHSGGGLGMFGAAAAGVHAASSLRGLGGNSAAEHSRYMDAHGPGNTSDTGSGSPPTGSGTPTRPPGPSGSGPGGAEKPTVIDGTVTSSAPAKPDAPAAAATRVPAGTGATAPVTSAGAGSTGAASASGTVTTTASAAGAATGPAAPVVLGAVIVTQAATQAAKAAGKKATDAMEGSDQ